MDGKVSGLYQTISIKVPSRISKRDEATLISDLKGVEDVEIQKTIILLIAEHAKIHDDFHIDLSDPKLPYDMRQILSKNNKKSTKKARGKKGGTNKKSAEIPPDLSNENLIGDLQLEIDVTKLPVKLKIILLRFLQTLRNLENTT